MTLIFHSNTDECNALVYMLTFPNAEDFISMVANKGLGEDSAYIN